MVGHRVLPTARFTLMPWLPRPCSASRGRRIKDGGAPPTTVHPGWPVVGKPLLSSRLFGWTKHSKPFNELTLVDQVLDGDINYSGDAAAGS